MAARGRGRGRRIMSFSVEAVGINRGETLPPSILQPTPLFPPMEQKPLPLAGGEEAEYMLALKQEFRGAMRSLPFFIQPAAPHRDVERYSDKYHSSEPADSSMDWTPDWKRLPKEL
uniref:DNA-directed RNA polymerase III subunit RPC7-like n=1 Tax=Centroberyx gerrardi TaxID=166262 RepID=UPI003AAC55EA